MPAMSAVTETLFGEETKEQDDAISKTPTLSVNVRYRAPALLIFGASVAILGFLLITVIGFIDFNLQTSNTVLKVPFNSTYGYWPSTVSEMVHNHESPGGKLFHTFGLIAGVCIFVSQYPFHLRNVYTGDERVPCTSMYWTTFRQICPAMGLWLLIGVNTYPTKVALASKGGTKLFCVFLHLVGAGMMFVGYMFCELKCLGMCGFQVKPGFLAIEGRERKVRVMLAYLITVGFVAFCIMQVLINVAKKFDVCCPDDWAMKGDEVVDINGKNHTVFGAPQIVDTASGWFLYFKVLSFFFEDVAGLALVASHVAIWYFCEERMVNFGAEQLKEVYRQAP